jgi:hypothetical protein
MFRRVAVASIALACGGLLACDATTTPIAARTPGACPASLQAAVNAAASGSTLDVTGCGPYAEVVTISKPLTLRGARVSHGTAALQHGNIAVTGTSNVVIDRATVTDSSGACVSVYNSSTVTISNSLLQNCVQEGYVLYQDKGVTFTGNHVTGNNAAHTVDTGWEAGGGKSAESSGLTFTNNEVDHNVGPGLWFDGQDTTVLVSGNAIHDNTLEGILAETQNGGRITNNKVWGNGWSFTTWVWGGGIVLSAASGIEVDHNIVAWNADGIGVIGHTRSDMPGNPVNINVHDNTVALGPPAASDSSDKILLGFVTDDATPLCAAGANNRGAANQFWDVRPEPEWARYGWCGHVDTLAAFNATPGGGGSSTYLSQAQLSAILSAAGMPPTP